LDNKNRRQISQFLAADEIYILKTVSLLAWITGFFPHLVPGYEDAVVIFSAAFG